MQQQRAQNIKWSKTKKSQRTWRGPQEDTDLSQKQIVMDAENFSFETLCILQ